MEQPTILPDSDKHCTLPTHYRATRKQVGRRRSIDLLRLFDPERSLAYFSYGVDMLWPIVLPFQITLCALTAFVALSTALAPLAKMKRGTAFFATTAMSIIVFIPCCSGSMSLIDARRFGIFHYAAFDDVNDFRVERFLPPTAQNITLEKSAMGHRARYAIKQRDLQNYVDRLWREYGQLSAVPRGQVADGTLAKYESFEHHFTDLDWPPMTRALTFQSPIEADGGGATYYFDQASSVAYHRAGYW